MLAVIRLLVIVSLVAGAGCDSVLRVAVGARQIEPQAAQRALPRALVIDLRAPGEFEAGHLPGSLNMTRAQVNGYLHRQHLLGARTVILVGPDAVLAAPTSITRGHADTWVLAGGVARWRGLGLPLSKGPPPPLTPTSLAPPRLALTQAQQLVSTAAGAVIKPTYMLLSLLLIIALRRGRSPGLRLLRHGLLWFLVGETFCALNFFWHSPGLVYPIDLLHGLGMVVMSTLVPWGLYRLLDDHLLRLSDPGARCLVQRFCGRCWKREQVTCGPHRIMQLLVAALAVVALMPLSVDLRPTHLVVNVFGTEVDYGAPVINQLVELRLYPVLACLGFITTLALLRGGPRSVRRAEPAFYVAFGLMAYSLLRHLLINTHGDALYWSDFWEESTELMLVLTVGMVLLVFKQQLGLAPAADRDARPSPADSA